MYNGCTVFVQWLYSGYTHGGKERMEQTAERFITKQKENSSDLR